MSTTRGSTGTAGRDLILTKHDKALWDAWMAGFEYGREEGMDDGNWPVRWILRAEYWAWRRRRIAERRR